MLIPIYYDHCLNSEAENGPSAADKPSKKRQQNKPLKYRNVVINYLTEMLFNRLKILEANSRKN